MVEKAQGINMLNVLLVDDDSEFSEVVCHIVEFLGHNINTAANLAEAEHVTSHSQFS